MTITTKTDYIDGYHPGYLGRIAEMHGFYYAKVLGTGVEFEGLMAEQLHRFFARYREGRDLLLTAHVNDRLVGSIAVDGSQEERQGARLRWVIVEEAQHGKGIGKRLLTDAMRFCCQAGFSRVFLWTVEGLPQSLGLYEKAGFEIIDRIPDERYCVPRVNLLLEKVLPNRES